MSGFDILINGGTFFGMNGGNEPNLASVAIKDGRISAFLPPDTDAEADFVYDASGLFVTPGFVDIHIHDEYFEDADTVQHCLIKQGITTAVAGNCGSGPAFDKALASRTNPWLHLSYLVGNCAGLREAVGHTDRYTPATAEEIEKMSAILRRYLDEGAMGLSLGLEYAPGASCDEINALAAVAAERENGIVTVHIRYDDDRCMSAVKEVINLSTRNDVRVQISHLGSMTMGHTRECEEIIKEAASAGADVSFDCYPYDAFCAKAGSAVYDDGFVRRWKGKGPEYLEAASGKYKGQRLTFETLAEMREKEPLELIVAHVMDQEEIENCVANPRCIIASDALFTGTGAHPRIAGTFPRAFGILRKRGYSWKDALRKATTMPADTMNLPAGRLFKGAVADIAVFSPKEFVDNATFQAPFLPPDGLGLVVINGKVALCDGELSRVPHGDLYKRPRKI
ncbi:MAG: amidohydrolase family protein [Synergistaceae bacterium]|jgi:N-acyl-D-amino-acid deacylase|nr:amidohydrolase family protein [Synergistaceae bacterium]